MGDETIEMRVLKIERAVFGYAGEEGDWVPGLLQNTADLVRASRYISRIGWAVVAFEALRGFGLSTAEQSITHSIIQNLAK